MSSGEGNSNSASFLKVIEEALPQLKHVLIYACAYGVMHVILDRTYLRYLRIYNRIPSNDRIYLAEKVSSNLNAFFIAIVALKQLLLSKEFQGLSLLDKYPDDMHFAFPVYAGYTLYDSIVMWIHGNEPLTMWAHHMLGLAGSLAIMIFRRASFFPFAFFITEVTVWPMNLIWFLKKTGISNDQPVLFQRALLWRVIFALLFRAPIAPFSVVYACQQLGGLRPFLQAFWQLPLYLSLPTVFNLTAFGAINIQWSVMMAITYWTTARKSKSLKTQ